MDGTVVEADSILVELRPLALQKFTSLNFLNLGVTTCTWIYYVMKLGFSTLQGFHSIMLHLLPHGHGLIPTFSLVIH